MGQPSFRSLGSAGVRRGRRRLALYRVVVWCLLLLAMFGVLQYSAHAWHVATTLQSTGADARSSLQAMLAWDVVYLLTACITVSVSAGVLLQREWARRSMRVLALLLAGWAVFTALQWQGVDHQLASLLTQPGLQPIERDTIAHQRMALELAMAMKMAIAPLLAWLAWHLGRAAVRGDFSRR